MSSFLEVIETEAIFLWFYTEIQIRQILPYWIIGILIGSAVSVFAKNRINEAVKKLNGSKLGFLGILLASILGILSPLCMFGTIPIVVSFAKLKMREDWIAAFMMSSILLNPQLLIYTMALGYKATILRLVFCTLGGVFAGVLINIFFRKKQFFNFLGFKEITSKDVDSNIFLRLVKNIYRNIKATGPYFLIGILLTVLYQRYIPKEWFASLFGSSNKGFGVLLSATIGVPLYVCGGGTIPLLFQWLVDGMSMGSAISFMITGPATKITNLAALKNIIGVKNFVLYLSFVIFYAIISGLIVDYLLALII